MAAEHNRLERLRDPSHARALSRAELEALLMPAGIELVDVQIREVRRPLAPWLEQTQTRPDSARQVRERLQDGLGDGPPTGMAPERADGELWFTHRLGSWIAAAR
ncbi:MAG: hypothetical protein ACRDMJ_15025 [Solirubrobacteraceae bacterium]